MINVIIKGWIYGMNEYPLRPAPVLNRQTVLSWTIFSAKVSLGVPPAGRASAVPYLWAAMSQSCMRFTNLQYPLFEASYCQPELVRVIWLYVWLPIL